MDPTTAMGRVTTIARSVMTVTGITARGAKLNRSKICRKAVSARATFGGFREGSLGFGGL